MKVPRYDYASQFADELPNLLQEIERMLLAGNYVLSSEVTAFEQAFALYLGSKHVCGLNSGTDALTLALCALEIGPGDEVLTQANTFHATVAAICQVGATPVLVDVDRDSYLMDMRHVRDAVTDRTKAIIPVHLYGKPTAMAGLLKLAASRGIDVIEDAAQAHGARIANRRVGTLGRLGCFSFHPSKNLAAAGDAGAICTDDQQLYERIQELRSLGQQGQNHHVRVGWNSKLDAIQAQILLTKLPLLDAWNQDRRTLAAEYRRRLADRELSFQAVEDDEEHAYHLFQVCTPQRDALLTHLRESEIDAVVRYPTPIHLQPAFAHLGWSVGQFPVAERLARELLCLPLRPGMPASEIDYVVTQVRTFFGA